jgi:FtsP/CotA-like multicopper oxidase with cupredoxin domain
MKLARRQLFRLSAAGGVFGLMGALAWPLSKRLTSTARAVDPGTLAPGDCIAGDSALDPMGAYAARYAPSAYLQAGARDFLHVPPPPRAEVSEGVQEISLPIIETTLEVANRRNLRVWAYGGTVPGPILRARLGERVRITVTNHTDMAHSLHFHGAHEVMQDGIQRIAPRGEGIYDFIAAPAGLHPYHCHVPPYACHIGKGMYGALIVDPPEGRPPAHEFFLCLCGFDVDATGKNDTYAWNGMAGYYARFPLKVPVGELVRIYLVNMVDEGAVGSFHLHAHTFDVFRSGTALKPDEHTDLITLGGAERAILEFRLPRRGRYMFHPHQSHMAERGAMGWIVAV